MNLMGEDFVQNKPGNSGTLKKILLISIIALVICIVIIILILALVKDEKKTFTIDGVANDNIKKTIIFENDGNVHISIRDIAEYLGYQSYSGNYVERSENANECYVANKQEVASFVANSNVIEKINPNTKESTYFTIDENIQMKDGKLYTTPKGIATAFNVYFGVTEDKTKVTIQTLPYLVEAYKKSVVEMGYKEISSVFDDQKTILKGLAIIKDGQGQYGLLDVLNKNIILETKYSNISYIPVTETFKVKSNGKIGIVNEKGEELIKMQYDKLQLISQASKLYVVAQDNRIGVINEIGDIKIPINFQGIGIDISKFDKNDLNNKYIIADKYIPIKKDNLWGLYNVDGERLTDFIYDGFGCASSSSKNAENVLIIPDYDIIIGKKNDKYYLINQYGEELYNGAGFDEAYIKIDEGQKYYYLVRNNKKYNAISALKNLAEKTTASEEPNKETTGDNNSNGSGELKPRNSEENNKENSEASKQENSEENNEENNEENGEENNEENNEENSEENNEENSEENNEENNE